VVLSVRLPQSDPHLDLLSLEGRKKLTCMAIDEARSLAQETLLNLSDHPRVGMPFSQLVVKEPTSQDFTQRNIPPFLWEPWIWRSQNAKAIVPSEPSEDAKKVWATYIEIAMDV
jgi:hypothetical protein